jgi:membrane fusion protein, adhesin transport system
MAMTGITHKDELLYMRDMHQAMVAEKQNVIGVTLILLLACLGAALYWASSFQLEEITRGNAKVIPSSREQIIQSLEGGILSEMLVKEGDVVKQGQPLLRIDPTKAKASYQEGQNKALALRATASRLRAEARGTALQFSADVKQLSELVKNETNTYRAKRQALDQSTTTIRRSKELIARELAMTEPMAAKGLVSEIELLRMRRQINELELQIQERFNKYRAEASNELNKVEAELSQTTEIVGARQDQVKRTTINAPLRGTVKNIRMNTIGGVVQPAQDIMEIVPLEDRLLVEAKIRPHDVAFLRPGLPATVKISAYDYSVYGGLEGEIEIISPDTLREEKKSEDENYYRVLVRTKNSTLTNNGKELPIIPGMTASVEIRTGEKSVLDYILKPVLKAREAMRER